jgi:hypothetical protein
MSVNHKKAVLFLILGLSMIGPIAGPRGLIAAAPAQADVSMDASDPGDSGATSDSTDGSDPMVTGDGGDGAEIGDSSSGTCSDVDESVSDSASRC